MERRLGPEVYADEGTPWEGRILRLKEDVRKCVVFLGWQEAGPIDEAPIDPKGTGFFIVGLKSLPGAYLATAGHVAKQLTPPFVIRVNKKGGGAQLIHIERPSDIEWCFHDDPTVDLAIAPILIPSWADACAINADGMQDDLKSLDQVDAGDPVCVVGLFHLLSGKRRNIPVTHVGHIATMPKDELIPVEGTLQEGYLVQANAISGCSGSPVFTARSVKFSMGDKSIIGLHSYAPMLGVWTSSWKVKGSEIVTAGLPDVVCDASGVLAPLGMGVVTPLTKLIDILWSENMKGASDRLREKAKKAESASPDMLVVREDGEKRRPNPTHREDFNRLLGAAVEPPKSSGRT
jgi:hypothetical protein